MYKGKRDEDELARQTKGIESGIGESEKQRHNEERIAIEK